MPRGRRFLLATLSVALATCALLPASLAQESVAVPRDYDYVVHKLEAKGAKPEFIRLLTSHADRDIQERVIRTNLLGFRLKPDYSGHIDDQAIRKCRAFLQSNAKTFRQAEKEHGVPKEVIAALLWVETRHGKTTGRFPIPSVFLNLAMADHPAFIERTLETLREEVPASDPQYPQLVEKVKTVATRKADWAVNELMAIQEIHSRHLANPFRIKGSYAGAFGMPQFLPSSYLKWSEGRSPSSASNLFAPRDAIHSVGKYLSAHGWGTEEPLQKAALHEYNHSDAYVNTILTLADKIRPVSGRRIAQE